VPSRRYHAFLNISGGIDEKLRDGVPRRTEAAESLIPILLFLATVVPAASTHRVSGVVLEGGSGAPIHGAVLALANGKRLAVTNRDGQFGVVTVSETFQVTAPGHATRSVAWSGSSPRVDVGKVFLWRSSRIAAAVNPPLAVRKLKWSLGRGEPGAKTVPVFREGVWDDKHPAFVIEDLEPGEYVLTFRGDGPLQVHATPVSVEAGRDVPVSVTILPTTVELQVFVGDKPQPDASVRFNQTLFLWSGTVECDDQGKASAELWQAGKFWVFAQVHGRVVDGQVETFATDRERIALEFHLPNHVVRGHVLDSSTGAPIAGANLSLEVAGKGVLGGVSDPDGSFEFDAVREGHHLLRAYKKAYRLEKPSSVTLTKDDTDTDQTVTLTPETAARHVRVVDAKGTAVVGGDVFFGFGAYMQPLEVTDETGRLTLPEGAGTLFVLPPDGSFGTRTVAADDAGEMSLAVPPGVGSVTITSQTTDHVPIPYVMFALRMNGVLLPPSVISRLASRHHVPFRTDGDGRAQLSGLPQGRYDVWPVRSREELDAIFSGMAPQPAATVVVTTLPEMVTLTFRPKAP